MCHHPVLLQFFCLGQPISTNRMRASEDTIFCVTASPSFRVPPPCMAALANPLSRSILLREPLNGGRGGEVVGAAVRGQGRGGLLVGRAQDARSSGELLILPEV
jgi:hypothetical protein